MQISCYPDNNRHIVYVKLSHDYMPYGKFFGQYTNDLIPDMKKAGCVQQLSYVLNSIHLQMTSTALLLTIGTLSESIIGKLINIDKHSNICEVELNVNM